MCHRHEHKKSLPLSLLAVFSCKIKVHNIVVRAMAKQRIRNQSMTQNNVILTDSEEGEVVLTDARAITQCIASVCIVLCSH